MGKIYAIKLNKGDYDYYLSWVQFVTFDKSVADNYIIKYNSLLNKLKEYYKQFYGFECSDYKQEDELKLTELTLKYLDCKDFGEAFIEEIEIR